MPSGRMPSVRELEQTLGDRLLELAEHGPPRASTGATTIPVDVYIDADRHRRELKAMANRPAAAVASSEIDAPGAFVTIQLGATPIIVTRDRGGHVHALVNACAHRGATVETRSSGSARILSCGFHGWSYDLDGSLRAVSDAPLFSSEPCDGRLTALACEERHGIVWVTADPVARRRSVGEWLGPELDELLAGLGLGGMVCHTATDLELACNWKMLTDGFLEIYHLKYLHRNSIAPYFPANTSTSDVCGDHLVTALPKNRLLRDMREQPRDEWQVFAGLTMAVTLLPGTVIQWQAGHVELFSLRPHPGDPARTTCRLTMLVPGDRADDRELWDRNWARVCETIPAEDFAVAEDVQRNIAAGATTELRVGANEQLLCEHLRRLDRLIAEVG